tara:strand:- start:343 stop:531 length:189 start_codon:yes stop_codon:yes gene_type:complete
MTDTRTKKLQEIDELVEVGCSVCDALLGVIEFSKYDPEIDGKTMCRFCLAAPKEWIEQQDLD